MSVDAGLRVLEGFWVCGRVYMVQEAICQSCLCCERVAEGVAFLLDRLCLQV